MTGRITPKSVAPAGRPTNTQTLNASVRLAQASGIIPRGRRKRGETIMLDAPRLTRVRRRRRINLDAKPTTRAQERRIRRAKAKAVCAALSGPRAERRAMTGLAGKNRHRTAPTRSTRA